MSVVTGALASLGPKLLQLLHDEYKIQKGVRKQVQCLHSELESIHVFLRKASHLPWDRLDEQVKVWAREVREASYDMEDVLDTFLVHVHGGEPTDPSKINHAMKKMGKVFRKAKARRNIAGAIQDIKKHLEEVAERRQKYKLDEMIMSNPITVTSTVDPRLTAMYKEVAQLIGIDNSSEELISMLNLSQPDEGDACVNKITKKVSVVGVGGLGKTTLAKAVYDKIKSQYDCGAFVSIGRDHDLVKVFKDILFDLDKIRYENIHNTGRGVDLLIREMREFLENKRYFIVIDDVWEVRTWEVIKLAIVKNNHGSKVITTTRNVDVAKASGEVYKLKPLSYDYSMNLFYTRVFGAERKYIDNQPSEVSDKILKKCAGIPLAIITMASLFAGKPEYKWSEVYNSIGFDSKDNREAEDTMIILSFSYYDLPPHLRTCLLYLSTYPEDYEIEKDSLIWKWIAEGFINGDQGTRLFELGERYLNDLINRSLIQVVETWDGKVSSCCVHDMVLDLMRKLSSEENFIAILGDNVEGTPALRNVHRLAHQNRIAEHINSEIVTRMPKARSYTAFKCFIDSGNQFLGFKLLRVLDIVGCKFKEGCRLEHLGDLLHLRYLGINSLGSDDPKLPKQIGNLKLLQTLDVWGTLPASIVDLTELIRLRTYEKVPDGIGKLVSLEELMILNGCSDNPKRFFKELGSLRELRVLRFDTGLIDESMQRDFVKSLSNLQKIHCILWYGTCRDADTAMWEATGFVLPRPLRNLEWPIINFSKLPSCINPSCLPNLSRLTIWVTTMDEQDLKLLARLPELCYLNLRTISTLTAHNINVGDCFFPKLRYFLINQMVQFEQPDEADASISLHIWNIWTTVDAIPFGSRKINCRKVVPIVVMQNLEVLYFDVNVRALMDNNGDCCDIGFEYLPCLRKVWGMINCNGVSDEEVDAALDVLRDQCKVHPNHPTLNMSMWHRHEVKDSNVSTEESEKQEEEADEGSQTADVDVGELSLSSS